MDHSFIHHYTRVEALAAILKSSRLRFTRLDLFDDRVEAQTVAGINFGEQFFASCWVKKAEEDIVQWSMYGDDKRGVRISLPQDPFEWHLLNEYHQIPGTGTGWHFNNAEVPFTRAEVFGDGYILLPVTERASFLKPVLYVEDVAAAYNGHVLSDGRNVEVQGFPTELARYKWNKWRFQCEHRFVLMAIRGPRYSSDPQRYGQRYSELVRDPTWFNQGALAQSIDLRISAEALRRAVVTIGPLANCEDRRRIDRLCAEYAPHITIRTSEFEGLVRPKR